MSTEKKNRPTDMEPEDQAALNAAGEAYNKATTDEERVKAHADAEAIRAKYKYSGGADGRQKIATNNTEEQARQQSYADVVTEANKVGNTGLANAANAAIQSTQTAVKPIQQQAQGVQQLTAQVPDFTGLLDAWMNSAKEQQNAAIDYATNKGVEELERAEADAQAEFDTQQNQINIDEAKALDNQALYAEARGDKGGIGQAQFGQIQATAMTNRRAVNSARTKLSTDTARAVADLRAQGEFEKADAILQLTQTYLGQLIELQQWGAEYALSVDQFNIQLQQWQSEYNMEMQKYLSSLEQWDKEFKYTVSQNELNQLIEQGNAMLAAGIRPSASQQKAMGYTDAQIDSYLAQYKLEQEAGVKKTGGGGNDATIIETLRSCKTEAEAKAYLLSLGMDSWEYKAYLELYNGGITADIKGGYDEVLTDIQALRTAGESSATINNVISKALAAKAITNEEAMKLRASYVGNR